MYSRRSEEARDAVCLVTITRISQKADITEVKVLEVMNITYQMILKFLQ